MKLFVILVYQTNLKEVFCSTNCYPAGLWLALYCAAQAPPPPVYHRPYHPSKSG
jgi:hypothetical protein